MAPKSKKPQYEIDREQANRSLADVWRNSTPADIIRASATPIEGDRTGRLTAPTQLGSPNTLGAYGNAFDVRVGGQMGVRNPGFMGPTDMGFLDFEEFDREIPKRFLRTPTVEESMRPRGQREVEGAPSIPKREQQPDADWDKTLTSDYKQVGAPLWRRAVDSAYSALGARAQTENPSDQLRLAKIRRSLDDEQDRELQRVALEQAERAERADWEERNRENFRRLDQILAAPSSQFVSQPAPPVVSSAQPQPSVQPPQPAPTQAPLPQPPPVSLAPPTPTPIATTPQQIAPVPSLQLRYPHEPIPTNYVPPPKW